MKYRTKPVEVEAVQFNKLGDHPSVVRGWKTESGEILTNLPKEFNVFGKKPVNCFVDRVDQMLQIITEINYGDFIVTDKHGRTFPVKPDAFNTIYEKVD